MVQGLSTIALQWVGAAKKRCSRPPKAAAICESCSASWGLMVVRGWLAYHSGGK